MTNRPNPDDENIIPLDETFSSPKVQAALNELFGDELPPLKRPTLAQVKQMAELADCFTMADGTALRMITCDDEFFIAEDDDGFHEYEIKYSDVTFEGHECFKRLVRMEIPE
jgi:hypothetical protein